MRTANRITALVFTALLLAGCRPASAPRIVTESNRLPQTQISSSGKAVNLQELGWHLQSGAKQKLSDLKGKVIVLDFWATNCPPCVEEIPHLVELQNKHREEGLSIVGLHVGDDEDRTKVPAFVKKLNIQYDLGYPEQELVSFLFRGTDDIPQTFVFDRSGRLVDNFKGYSPEIKAGLDKAVLGALAN